MSDEREGWPEDAPGDTEESRPRDPVEVVQAEALFQGRREIWIELDGVRYRLRITRRNKLILQK
jgi:hemin uptake protein HemP